MTEKVKESDFEGKYRYDAEVLRVIDGDTIEVRIDLGMETFRIEKCRLRNINAPEKRGVTRQAGMESKGHLAWLLHEHEPITVLTVKDRTGKYGRYLIEIFSGSGLNLNDAMVEAGQAVYKNYA